MAKLKLSRDQLKKFLPDEKSIREFEKLFNQSSVENPSEIEAVSFSADNANANANEALALLETIKSQLELLLTQPPKQVENFSKKDYIDFNLDAPHETLPRRMQWNPNDGTIDVGLEGGSVVLQMGQETLYYVKNTSGATISNGSSVMATGTVGLSGKITVAPANGDGSINSRFMLGIATEDILNNDFGYITSFGLIRGINTTGSLYGETWADGDILYIHPNILGGLTKNIPTPPQLRLPIAIVINASGGGSGSIFTRMKTGEYLDFLLDVYISSKANNDVLQYNSTNQRWENTQILKGLKYGGTSTNNTFFEADGTLVANGEATTWKDIDFPIIIRNTGPNIPTISTLKGNITAPLWQVNDYVVLEAQEMQHEWKEGSEFQWHIHVVTNGLDTTNRYLRFEIEWFWANVNGALSATITTTSPDLLIPANTPTNTMLAFEIAKVTIPALKIAGHVWARLKRVASVGTAPTLNPFCSMLQIHIECDTLGSRQIFTK